MVPRQALVPTERTHPMGILLPAARMAPGERKQETDPAITAEKIVRLFRLEELEVSKITGWLQPKLCGAGYLKSRSPIGRGPSGW